MKETVVGFMALLIAALLPASAGAWSHAGRYGGSASGGGGSYNAHNAYGTTAYGGTSTYTASNHYATTTYNNSGTYYGGSYSTYHPPTTVNYYGSSCSNCGGWSTAGAAAAGVAVGA